tara:strand:+ start:137 stop:748 length:612 start_codon:yes stop_codon:yes gene_type:complete
VLDKFVVLGYSGHSKVVCEAAILNGFNIDFYMDVNEKKNNFLNLKYLGDENNININTNYKYILAVGDNILRDKIAKNIKNSGGEIISVIHPNSNISSNTKIGSGVFISKNTSINPFTKIKDFSIINTGSIVEHDCQIGTSSHIAPGAVLGGNVKVGNRTFIGANSFIKEGIIIGDDVIIGAGSVVLNNIKSNSIFVGNPAKKK